MLARSTIRIAVTLTLAGAFLTPSPAVAQVAPSPEVTVVAVGDIACAPGDVTDATSCQQASVADLIGRLAPQQLLTLGDHQYPAGSLAQFQQSYDLSFGRFKNITRPVPGNHEYQTPGAAGYFDYFGASAGDRTKGWYSYDVGSWHVVTLNSACDLIGGCHAGSAQEQWLRADLAANAASCTLVQWHRPRWSSSPKYGSDPGTGALFQAAYDAGADVLLSGHAHAYERIAPLDPAGQVDLARGVRQFSVGTGGVDLIPFAGVRAHGSEAQFDTGFGALKLSLRAGGYAWQMVRTNDAIVDSGEAPCSGNGRADTTAPSAAGGLSAVPSADGRQVQLSFVGGRDESGLVGHRITRDGVVVATVGDTGPWTDRAAKPGTTATYAVTAIDAAGNASAAASATVTLPAASTRLVRPSDDSWVEEAAPTATHGSSSRVTADGSPRVDGLLRFDAPADCTPVKASLELTVGTNPDDDSDHGGVAHRTGTGWSASTVSWSTAPAAGAALGTLAAGNLGATVSLDVSAAVTTSGPVAFRLIGGSTDGVRYLSSEASATQGPLLVLECASNTADSTAPTAPSAVTVTETSPGTAAVSWAAGTDASGVVDHRVSRNGVVVATVPLSSGATWTDTGLAGGTTYAYTVTARDAAGNESAASSPAQLTTQAAAPPDVVRVGASDDSWVEEAAPTVANGSNSRLVADGSPRIDGLIRFAALPCTPRRAVLELTVGSDTYDLSDHGGLVHATSPAWQEATVTWASAPLPAAALGALPGVALGATVALDVTSAVSSTGPSAFRLVPGSTDGVRYFSSEASPTQGPRLVVECDRATPTPDTSAPTAPSALTGDAESPTRVSLRWMASTDDIGVVGYRVSRDGSALATVTTVGYVDSTASPGTQPVYTVVAVDAAGNASTASSVAVPMPATYAPGTVLTFLATADTQLVQRYAGTNYGARSTFVVDASPRIDSLLRFAVATQGCPVARAEIILVSTDPSGNGGAVHRTSAAWDERTVTWQTAPVAGTRLGAFGGTATGSTYTAVLTGAVADGPLALRMTTSSSDGAGWAARESGAAKAPRLRITCG